MNEIKQTLQQYADALLKRLKQNRKNGTGVTLSVSDVGVLCEAFKQLNDGFLNLKEKISELRDEIDLSKYQVCNFDSDRVFSELEDIQFRLEVMVESNKEPSND
ncbi:hypothetical protein [Acinetobacter ursingii]|uniref:Uncharacterized protein n=1 Tax=Acinetobacter ursingii TaxID=108980 RepID=A0AA46S2W8_9GAMM|nr:hypothetical protein [Acinetobacter ursingii]UYF70526.1 hypothetical protein LSO60_09475 [Acinetobacter ursingii]